ncbi:NADPH-dependent F420 reductase [Xanthomonas phaseoli]|uniref:NADPH-dependent F420 reductase n=2 Tax=Xanthomonas TaxID=338 RepID=UPI0023E3AB35|nr:NAD(P)-binding domain-containing protein [Xanthomonas phaseoli]
MASLPTTEITHMNISIIGAGAIGSAIARKLAKAGISATIANQRGPESLKALVADLAPYITAVTVAEATQADVVFVAVNWGGVQDALANAKSWSNRIVVDANNAVEVP